MFVSRYGDTSGDLDLTGGCQKWLLPVWCYTHTHTSPCMVLSSPPCVSSAKEMLDELHKVLEPVLLRRTRAEVRVGKAMRCAVTNHTHTHTRPQNGFTRANLYWSEVHVLGSHLVDRLHCLQTNPLLNVMATAVESSCTGRRQERYSSSTQHCTTKNMDFCMVFTKR